MLCIEDKNILSVSTITLGKETKSQISEDETSHMALPATNIGGINVFFYKKEGSSYFFASFEQNNVSYTVLLCPLFFDDMFHIT